MDHPVPDNVNYVLIADRRDIVIDELGRTAVHIAAEEGNLAEVKILLENGNDGTIPDYLGKTPLHYATAKDHDQVVKFLLNYNTDFDTSDNIFRTPLHVDAEVTECIFAKPDYLQSKLVAFVNAEDKDGKLALRYALDNANKQRIITLLIAHGSRIPEDMGGFKLLPLYRGFRGNPYFLFLVLKHPELIAEIDIEMLYCVPLVPGNCHTKVMNSIFTNVKFGVKLAEFVSDLSREINRSFLLTDANHLKCLEYLLTVCPEGVPVDETLISASRQGHLETYKRFITKGHKLCKKHVESAIEGNSKNILEHLWENHNLCPDYRDRNIILHLAVAAGKWQVVKYLVEKGADGNARDMEGRTPLHYAYRYPQDDLARYLIDHGADVNAVDNAGLMALNSVLSLTSLRYFLPNPFPPTKDLLEYLIAECNARLGSTCKSAILQEIYLNGDVNRKGGDGKCLLHLATELGSKLLMRHLIEKGADVNVKDSTGKTPLHYCAMLCDGKSARAAKCLLLNGAMYAAKDDNNNTAEDYFLQLKGKHFKATDRLRRTRKLFAGFAEMDRWEFIYVGGFHDRKNRSCSPSTTHNVSLDAVDLQGNTLLHLAVEANNHKLVCQILGLSRARTSEVKKKYRRNRQNIQGNTPLHIASAKGCYDSVRSMINHGHSFNSKNREGCTPEQLALRNGHDKIALFLQSMKSTFDAVKENNEKRVRDSVCSGRCIFDNDVFEDEEGRSLLHWAAFHGHLQIAKLLRKQYYDVKGVDNNGCRPLHFAAAQGHLPMVKFLLDHQSTFNPTNEDGKTPFDLATGEPARLLGAITACFQGLRDNPNSVFEMLKSTYTNDKETFSYIIKAVDHNTSNQLLRFVAIEGLVDFTKFLLGSGGSYRFIQRPEDICPNQECKLLFKFLYDMCQFEDELLYSLSEVAADPAIKAVIQGARFWGGNTLFHRAIEEYHINYFRLNYLLEIGVDINARNDDGATAIQGAIKKKKFELVWFFIKKKANLMNITRRQRVKLFHEAAEAGRHDIIKSFKSLQEEQENECRTICTVRSKFQEISWDLTKGFILNTVRASLYNLNLAAIKFY